MHFKQLLIPALVSSVAAQNAPNLTDALASQNSTLSSLNAYLQEYPRLLEAISNAQNVTILAPSNDAVNAAIAITGSTSPIIPPGDLQALVRYHVLNGTYYASNFSTTPQFIPTLLTNTSYTNVTGGQRVECVSDNNNLTFISALKQNITAVTTNINFTGGTIHIVNGILSVPDNLTDTLVDANLTASAGAIAAANQTQNLSGVRRATIFAPNNAAFHAIGSILGNQTAEQLGDILGYHVVNGTVAYAPDFENGTLRAMNGDNINIKVIGRQIFANSARVTVPDVLYANGVIHVIDQSVNPFPAQTHFIGSQSRMNSNIDANPSTLLHNRVLNPNNTCATPNPSATTAGPAYTGASSGTAGIPYTSGVTTTTTTFPAATSAGGETPSPGVAAPMRTGAVRAAVLFGGAAAMFANF
ncbi:FAS1 domain-containing protein [Nemania sp. NC0429]|nr:FAS1 domain-containing protein [Nemania sp. NC0429]